MDGVLQSRELCQNKTNLANFCRKKQRYMEGLYKKILQEFEFKKNIAFQGIVEKVYA